MTDTPPNDLPPPVEDAAAVLARLAPDALYAAEQDMWVRQQPDGTLLVGATHWVAEHGQFMLFTPRQPGAEVQRDWSLGVMETAKTAVAIHAPVSSRVLEFNPAVVEDVGLVARDPYGAGWLFRVQPLAWAEERGALLDAASYAGWAVPRLASLKARPIADQFNEDLSVDPHRGY